jgi:hypothetical protein
MARYRKIDARMWGDSRFRDLSSPDPSGKYLWMFLLTGPQTSNIPGLFRAGEMALAEELEWGPEGFRKAFAELFAKGLVKADWKARVVWIPNAIKYNAPDNPNVVKSWRTAWDEIPECTLKAEAYERLKTFTEALGEGFGKAFVDGCAKGLANQEQEQEQEQDQLKPSLSEQTICCAAQSQNHRQGESTDAIASAPSKASLVTRGTRLPQDFAVTEEHRKFANEIGADVDREFFIFRDYWVAQPGQKGVKTDWNATFRNWLRRAAETHNRNGHGGRNGKPSIGEIVEREQAIVRSRSATQ